jgi:hypothetical protein
MVKQNDFAFIFKKIIIYVLLGLLQQIFFSFPPLPHATNIQFYYKLNNLECFSTNSKTLNQNK